MKIKMRKNRKAGRMEERGEIEKGSSSRTVLRECVSSLRNAMFKNANGQLTRPSFFLCHCMWIPQHDQQIQPWKCSILRCVLHLFYNCIYQVLFFESVKVAPRASL